MMSYGQFCYSLLVLRLQLLSAQVCYNLLIPCAFGYAQTICGAMLHDRTPESVACSRWLHCCFCAGDALSQAVYLAGRVQLHVSSLCERQRLHKSTSISSPQVLAGSNQGLNAPS